MLTFTLILISFVGFLVILINIIPFLLESKSNDKQKIDELNKLYECSKCKKYHRKYQEIIAEKSDENYKKIKSGNYRYENGKLEKLDYRATAFSSGWNHVCPHCLNEYSSSVKEDYEWTKYHQDSPILDKKKYKSYTKMLEEIDRIAYEIRSMDKFMEKNNLI